MKWISVEDKLPDEKGQYLVVYHPCYWDSIKPELKVGIDSFRGKNSWAKKKYQKVTHWAPMPSPPSIHRMCTNCSGNGLVPLGDGFRGVKRCPVCNGKGVIIDEQ